MYEKDVTLSEDDDEYWIGGMIYYNPGDTRLNVEKRVGYGATVNAAHPVGMAVYITSVLLMIFTIGALVYIAVCGINVQYILAADKCHHISFVR